MTKLLIVVLFLPLVSFSQLSTFEKKGKTGLKEGEAIVIKPKYDSIVMGDTMISTAFKKSKVILFNKEGESVYKGKKGQLSVFKFGAGFLKNKKGEIGAINRSGDFFIEPSIHHHLSYQNQLIYLIDTGYNGTNKLFFESRVLEKDIKNVELFDNWVVAEKYKTEISYRTVKTGVFKKKREEKVYTTTYWKKVYEGETGKEISRSIDDIYRIDDMVALKSNTDLDLYFNGDKILESVTFIESRNDSLYEGATQKNFLVRRSGESDDRFLMNKKTKQILVQAPHLSYDIFENVIFGHGDFDDHENVHIYTLQGELIRSDLKKGSPLDATRFVFRDSLGEFIGDEFGSQLSQHYQGFGDVSEGIRKVYFGYSYGYINDSTYEDSGINWPVVAENISYTGGSGRRKSLFRGLGRDLGNFGRRLIGNPTKGKISGYSGVSFRNSELPILDDGHDFSDGMAVVCLNGLRRDAKYDTLISFFDYQAIYSYITPKGKLMSTVKYSKCHPFKSGLAWVKYGGYYSRINKSGKVVKKTKYAEVISEFDRTFKVKKDGKWGLIDENYNFLIKCEHPILTWKEGAYYSKKDGQEILELRLSK
ncbi:MAG: hypothetical protein ACI857_000949 [Arenicella sp.]|jgi:hypothetical protein